MKIVWKNTSEKLTEMKKVGLAGSPPLKGTGIDIIYPYHRVSNV
jgi:hypothetical protein